MSKLITIQDGSLSINPATGIVELYTDVVTATPPEFDETAVGAYEIWDADRSDQLARIGFLGLTDRPTFDLTTVGNAITVAAVNNPGFGYWSNITGYVVPGGGGDGIIDLTVDGNGSIASAAVSVGGTGYSDSTQFGPFSDTDIGPDLRIFNKIRSSSINFYTTDGSGDIYTNLQLDADGGVTLRNFGADRLVVGGSGQVLIHAAELGSSPPVEADTYRATIRFKNIANGAFSNSLAQIGFNDFNQAATNELRLSNYVHGGQIIIDMQNAAGTTQTLMTFDPDTEQVILPLSNDNVTPTLAFGDGNTGFYESADNTVRFAAGGLAIYECSVSIFQGLREGANGPRLAMAALSDTDIAFSFTGDSDTGMGRNTSDVLFLQAGGVELLRLTEDVGGNSITANAPLFIAEQAAANTSVVAQGQLWVRTDNTLMFTDEASTDYAIGGGTSGAVTATGSPLVNEVAVFTDATTIDSDSTFTWSGTVLQVAGAAGFEISSSFMGNSNSGRSRFLPEASTATNPNIIPRGDDVDTGIAWAAADQLSLVSGGVEMLRLVETGTNTTDQVIIMPAGLSGSATAPALAFGDGDTGFYENSDDELRLTIGGTLRHLFDATVLRSGSAGGGYRLLATAPSATVPSLMPETSDTDTGIGRAAANQLSLIAGAVEASRITAATVQTPEAAVTEIISVAVASGEGFGFEVHVMGTQDATGDTVFERVFGAIRNQAGTTALVGSIITDRTDDAGASTWVISVEADDTGDALTVDVTGEAAHTIDWKVRVELLQV